MAAVAGLVVVLTALSAGTASAATFFVTTAGNNANNCTSSATACLTINGAITRARAGTDTANTINVGPGTFVGNVNLDMAADGGTEIVGSGSGPGGTVIQGVNGAQALVLGNLSSGNDISHLKVVNSPGGNDNVVAANTKATFTDVAIAVQNPGSAEGLGGGFAPLVFDGGSVTMANGSTGQAVQSPLGGMAIRSSTVTLQPGASGPAMSSSVGPFTMTDSTVTISASGQVALSGGAGDVVIKNTTINQGSSTSQGISSTAGSLDLSNVTVNMTHAANTSAAVTSASEPATLDHLMVSGTWKGTALVSVGDTTLRDSRLTTPAASTSSAALLADGGASGRSMLVQRSIVQQGAAAQNNLLVSSADLTLDSSAVLGGQYAVLFTHSNGKARKETIIGSTIDAGTLGTRDALPTSSILSTDTGGSGSSMTILAQGSILVDSQTALLGGGGETTTMTCSDSDAPDQTQAADATHGAINCAAGSNGNTTTNPLTDLFTNPGTDYSLKPATSAIDGVPDAGITPPSGVTLSATDLAGNARKVDGTGDCAALRDKGAFELQGHEGIVPAPVIGGPAAGTAGTPLAFTATAPNIPGATPVTFSWLFTGGATANGESVSHAFTQSGAATAAVTATTGGSCTGSATKQLTITPAITIDQISALKITPNTLIAASSGASIAATKKTGAQVSYVGTQPATTKFTVQRKASGRKSGKRCVKPTKKNAAAKRCTRYITVGSFSHTDAAAGAIKFRFTGRVNGKKLAPGRYRLRAVPTNAAGKGKTVSVSFRVKT